LLPWIFPAVRAALADTRARIRAAQRGTRAAVAAGLARALGGGLYADGDEAGGTAAGGAGGGVGDVPPPRRAAAAAADVVGRCLGLDVVAGSGPVDGLPYRADPAAEMMGAWFAPRGGAAP
jgi:hypothetical protein